MKDTVDAFYRFSHSRTVADIADDKVRVSGYVFPLTCREIVQNAYVGTIVDERIDEVRPDKPAAAGYQITRHD